MPIQAWDDLRIVLAVSRSGSATSAARRLGLVASTITRRIAQLEAELGTPLFLRTRAGLRPTAAGDELATAGERIEAEIARVGARVWPADAVVGTVRVATTEGLATMLAEQGLLRLTEEHPGLALELLAGNAELDLDAGAADLALRPLRPRASGLFVRRASSSPLAVVAAPRYLDRRGTPRTEAELAGHDVVVAGGELAGLPEARWLAGVTGVRVVLRSNGMPAIVAAIRDGVGIGVVSEIWATLAGGTTMLFRAPLPSWHLWLVTSRASAERTAVQRVGERILEILRDQAVTPPMPRTPRR